MTYSRRDLAAMLLAAPVAAILPAPAKPPISVLLRELWDKCTQPCPETIEFTVQKYALSTPISPDIFEEWSKLAGEEYGRMKQEIAMDIFKHE